MIYRCIQNFSRGYKIYEVGTLWERFPSTKEYIFRNIETNEWIICSKTEFDLYFIEV